MFRSAIELELLAQAKVDDLYANHHRPSIAAAPSNPPYFTGMRRRIGLRLIATGTRLVGPDSAATTRPAMAGQ
jgi:hypothetical protein